MKKITKCVALGVSILSIATTAMGATFSDVEGTDYEWALPYVEDMAEQALISGYPDGTYKPEKEISKLEAISLFARAMGSRSEANTAAVKYAMAEYDELLKSFELTFGGEDVAFMLYRGVLTEAEAKAYLSGDTKSEPMLRYEAATIITKAMGGEAEAKEEVILPLDYTDTKDIPSTAKKYVYYVTKKGIMAGGGDGTFAPNNSVSRAQVAVMLSKTVNAMELSLEEVTIEEIDADAMTMTVTYADGDAYELEIAATTSFYLEGEKVQAKEVPQGVAANITLDANGLLYVDIESAIPDAYINVVYNSYSYVEGILSVIVTEPGKTESQIYECADDLTDITKDGVKTNVPKLAKGDYLTIKLSKGKVVSIAAVNKTTVIKAATIEAINYDGFNPVITISHADEEFNGLELELANDAIIRKGGEVLTMTSIYRGDKVQLTLEYGIIKELAATSTKGTIEGTIRAISISATPTITVLTNDKEVVYDITSDIKITANGEDATLYDFKIGDKVTLTTESNAVVKIDSVTVLPTDGEFKGVVTAINTAIGNIKISGTDVNGNAYTETIICKPATTFLNAEGETKQIRDVKVDSTVMVFGSNVNGFFEAKTVIIIK